MNVFGLGTSSLYAAGLSALVALTFIAGLIKVALNKRDLKKKVQQANLEAANKQTDLEKLVGNREPDEGDLFGVRAIQAGFFGGVSQSCPNSPSTSRSSSVCSLGINSKEASFSKSSPLHLELPKLSRNTSQTSRNTKTSLQNSTSSVDSPTSQGHQGNNNSFGLQFNSINPLITSERSNQLTSESDKDQGKTLSAILVAAKPTPKSVYTSNPSPEEGGFSSQEPYSINNTINRNPFPSAYHRSTSSEKSHSSLDEDCKSTNQGNSFAGADLLLPNLPRQISPLAIIRDSVVSKQKVSIHLPVKTRRLTPNDKRLHGDVISSICSMRTSIADPITDQPPTIDSSEARVDPDMTKTASTTGNALPRGSSTSSRNMETELSSQGYTLMTTNQTESAPSQQSEIDSLRDSSISESNSRVYSSSSSQSSSSAYDKPYRLTSAELTPFALQNFELPPEEDSGSLGSNLRASRYSISDLYDTYYRQTNLYQSGMHNVKEFDFDLRATSTTRT